MSKNKVKVKISKMEVVALHELLLTSLTFKEPLGFKEMLIHELMIEVLDQIDKMQHNEEQKKFTLKLSGAQSMAFMGYFGNMDLQHTPYEMSLIYRINETIHKKHTHATYTR